MREMRETQMNTSEWSPWVHQNLVFCPVVSERRLLLDGNALMSENPLKWLNGICYANL